MKDKRSLYVLMIFLGLLILTACSSVAQSGQKSLNEREEANNDIDTTDEQIEEQPQKDIDEMTDEELREIYPSTQVSYNVFPKSRYMTNKAAFSKVEHEVMKTLGEYNAVPADGGTMLTLPDNILFDFDSDQLKNNADKVIQQLVGVIESTEGKVLIVGHTDSKGKSDYNQKLSERRAESVKEALIKKGINEARIEATGKGDKVPVANNTYPSGKDNPAGREKNRRVEVTVQ